MAEGNEIDEDLKDEAEEIPNESKNERFRRLAQKRVTRLIHNIDTIGNLANRMNYEYTEEEVNAIFLAITDAIEEAQKKFSKTKKRSKQFTF